ncbi:AAA family ATPase [Rhodoferax sp.]|uniref:AAA family ATPase n=1 Tax=Rhodoferax sp. TaxID=50421 RepID=UPI0027660803|nr:AAA family ATPase [Rhodoferax sp.]
MHCTACQAVNPDTNRFCERCGTVFTQPCPSCAYICGANARFCGGCGVALERRDGALVAQVPPTPATETWGELKQATVLFADIVGSTEHIAGLDPEQAMEHLRPAVFGMCEAVERFGGTVIRTLGDGVMALFGVPKSLEGHALLACHAAQAMVAASGNWPVALQLRVGLHSGQVASDPQDAKYGLGGGAHGLTIHLASRVVALAQPGGICLTGVTKALLGHSGSTQFMGEYALKGIAGRTPIHELHAIAGARADGRSGPHFDAVTGLDSGAQWVSTFRGRQLELDILKAALARALAGDARVLGISAEPGGGKSRLSQEFVRLCRAQGLSVCEVRAQLYGQATPLQPILALLRRQYFHIANTDCADIVRTRITQRLQALEALQASPDDVALACEFLGVAAPDALACTLSPRAKHERMLALMRQLVRDAGRQPGVILFEDLHWLDEASEGFVAALVEAVAGSHTLVVMNYRPHYRVTWAQAPHFTQLDLPDLSASDMHVLVDELLGGRAELAEVCKLIVVRSAGNPFFAEELARTLIDSALLADIGAGGPPPGRLEQIEHAMPDTVQAVIGAKVDRLGEPEKTLLQMCAIIGKEIPMAVIEQVASHLRMVLERGLAGLCHAGLILAQSDAGQRRFVFRHPIIQEVTYSMQLKVRRVSLHLAVAHVMETYYRERLDEFAGLIAYHYEAADERVPAAEYSARAARWIGATDSAQALKSWRRVWDLLQDQPRSAHTDSLRALAGGRVVYLGWREGLTLEEVQRLTNEALALATQGDARLVQLLLFARGRMMQSSGLAADLYVDSLLEALALSPATLDAGRRATLNLALSHAHAWSGLLHEGLAANDIALSGLPLVDQFDRDFIGFNIEQWAMSIRVRLLNRLGRFDEALTWIEQATASADASGDPVMQQIARHIYVDYAWCKGDVDLARDCARRAPGAAAVHMSPYSQVFEHCSQGFVQLTLSNFQSAKQAFSEALNLISQTKVAVEFEAEVLCGLADCCWGLNQDSEAAQMAERGFDKARSQTNRIASCRALIVWSKTLARHGQSAQLHRAETMLRDAEELISVTGAVFLLGGLQRAQDLLYQAAR